MSATSPADHYASQSEGGKSPLSMSLGFLKTLTEKKTTRVDGQTPKRRGPKPDSKPALTRRQELNRQAQRTHRERKELYIKALEQEVLRLKENFSMTARDKDALAEENRQLKTLLAQHGITWNGTGGVDELTRNTSVGVPSSGSISGSYQSYSLPPQSQPSSSNYTSVSPTSTHYDGRSMAQRQIQGGVDYDQAGIDFVLTLERPCMDHMQFLVDRSSEPEGPECGHALMASCPPERCPEMYPDVPFGHESVFTAENGNTQKTWELSKFDLVNLLDLSKRLNLEGEITPVMAWGMVLGHPRFSEFNSEDFTTMCQELLEKVRCYGFGAVLEEFEVRDVLSSVFYTKPEPYMTY